MLFHPFRASLFPTFYPRLTPWAAFSRRFAAKPEDLIPPRSQEPVLTQTLKRCATQNQRRQDRIYFLLALPSITVPHLVPSCDISNVKLYEEAEVTLMVNRPFMVMVPIFSSLVHVQVSPSRIPLESSNSPKLLNSR